jgi:hypothetical protein
MVNSIEVIELEDMQATAISLLKSGYMVWVIKEGKESLNNIKYKVFFNKMNYEVNFNLVFDYNKPNEI